MYKKSVIVSVLIFILLSCIAYSAEVEQMSDMITKIMKASSKDVSEEINRNMDENFKQLDERINNANDVALRKSVFVLAGTFMIVLFGYAYILNRIQKKYDINFYEKLFDSKISQLQRYPYIVKGKSSFYASITNPQFDRRYETPITYMSSSPQEKQIEELKKQVSELKKNGAKNNIGRVMFYKPIYLPSSQTEPKPVVKAQENKSNIFLRLFSWKRKKIPSQDKIFKENAIIENDVKKKSKWVLLLYYLGMVLAVLVLYVLYLKYIKKVPVGISIEQAKAMLNLTRPNLTGA